MYKYVIPVIPKEIRSKRSEKHGLVTSGSAVSLYVFLLLISFGVTFNNASGVN